MQQGLYVCELPDPRAPSRGVIQQGTSFRITSASRYISDQGTGTYLRRGNVVLIPIRVGAGLRLGANVGYMKFSKKQRWLPF